MLGVSATHVVENYSSEEVQQEASSCLELVIAWFSAGVINPAMTTLIL